MAKRNADNASSTPAVWERLLGALLWATIGAQIWLHYGITILVVVLTLILVITQWKRRPFLVRLCGWVLTWCLVPYFIEQAVMLVSYLRGMPYASLSDLFTHTLPNMYWAPKSIPFIWQHLPQGTLGTTGTLLGVIALNILFSLFWFVYALIGGRPRRPRAESAPLPEAV